MSSSPAARGMGTQMEEQKPLAVAIIGAGPLGRWLALRAARAGLRVMLEDVMPSNLHHAREYIRQELNQEGMRLAGGNVGFVSTIEDAVREAELAIDCVPDELESKLEAMWLLDRMSPPKTVFATPTLNMSIEDLANCTYRPDRCIAIVGAPRKMAELEGQENVVIELRTAAATSPETVALVSGFWQQLGFKTSVAREC